MSRSKWIRLGLAVVVAVAIARLFFVVDETEYAVITRFGAPVHEIMTPGLYLKAPWDNTVRIDARLRAYDPGPAPANTRDKKVLQVDNYVCWRVAEPKRFIQTVQADETMAKQRLLDLVRSEMNAELGKLDLSNVIAIDPDELMLEEVTQNVTQRCAKAALANFGIEILDVGIKRLVFPEQNLESVYARMRAERQRMAKKYRAEGQEEAERIRAEADKERDRILSEAYRLAETTKGEGEAEATRTYAAAHSADPGFYKMVRTLQAYETMFGKDTTVVLSADSELLRLLTEGRAGVGSN